MAELHLIQSIPEQNMIQCSCGYRGPASMCPQHLYDARQAEKQTEIDQIRSNIARARGLAEAIRDLNEKSYSLTGLREVAAEIVELLTDPQDNKQRQENR